jgi:signal transduction histidine kinase
MGADRTRIAVLSALSLAALGLGAALLALTPGATSLPAGGRAVPVFVVIIGWGFVGVGCAAWRRRPDNRTGALLVAFGFTVLVSGFVIADTALAYLASRIADPLAIAVFIHLLLAFPAGRVDGRPARSVVAAAYAVALLTELATVLFDPDLGGPGCATCPDNRLLVADRDGIADIASALQSLAGLALIVAAIVLTLRRRRTTGAAGRRGLDPLLAAGAAVLALGALSATLQNAGAGERMQQIAQLLFIAAFALLPAAFLLGMVRTQFFRAATLGGLLDRLTAAQANGGLDGALVAALDDPSAAVVYWLADRGAYVGRDGRPVALPAGDNGVVATELRHRGRRVGALLHAATLAEDPALMSAAAGAAALAVENDRLEVELRAQVEALRDSRARIVATGDNERRRLGRDLHDGAQQRLVSLLIGLQLAEQRWSDEPEAARELVAGALGDARAAVDELRDLAAGIHPAILSQRGLDAAVETLAARAPVPVELHVDLAGRLPVAVETAAYFVISEALANVAKHARATHARVSIWRQPSGVTVVEIADDGCGGAGTGAGAGTGLTGLADRVGALDGTLALQSPPGGGSLVRACFPPT